MALIFGMPWALETFYASFGAKSLKTCHAVCACFVPINAMLVPLVGARKNNSTS